MRVILAWIARGETMDVGDKNGEFLELQFLPTLWIFSGDRKMNVMEEISQAWGFSLD